MLGSVLSWTVKGHRLCNDLDVLFNDPGPSANPVAYAEYEARLTEHLRTFYGECLGLDDRRVRHSIERRLTRERGVGLARMLDDLVGLDSTRMLDIGSGWGELLLECIMRGAVGSGIEPDAEEVAISELLLESYGFEPRIAQGRGEALPWSDESFDLVTCQQVLEHVDDIERVVSEMIRVTRPGGAMFVSTPNYLFPYEGHYMLKWFPLLPKRIGASVLRAKGRDPTFLLEHVNYTTYPSMRRLWRRHGLPARNITLELVRSRRHQSTIYWSSFVRPILLGLRLFPNVSWLVTKPLR